MAPFVNTCMTGIPEIDIGIEHYFSYLQDTEILPDGTYALAGGSIRCLLDNTKTRDLDIYILGNEATHIETISNIIDGAQKNNGIHSQVLDTIKLYTSLSEIEFLNFIPNNKQSYNTIIPIQIISFKYDKDFVNKIISEANNELRYSDTYASSLMEVINSFDLTLSKAGVEFIVKNNKITISTIYISPDCLVDVCLRKLRLNRETDVPTQLCSLKRFYKFIKLGYTVEEDFFTSWSEKLRENPYLIELSYDK